jgi:hypothetical protein
VKRCELCDNPATCHVTEMVEGIPRQRHFCEEHAQETLLDERIRMGLPASLGAPRPFFIGHMEGQALVRLAEAFKTPGVSGVLGGLIELLKDRDRAVRYYGAVWLGQLGPQAKEAIPHLRALLDDQDEHVGRVVKYALARIEGRPGE